MSQQLSHLAGLRLTPPAPSPDEATEVDASAAPAQRLAALAGVKASVTVVAGAAQSTVGQLLALKMGDVVVMDSELNTPFDIVLGGQVIARGDLVAVGDHLGVRITQLAPVRA